MINSIFCPNCMSSHKLYLGRNVPRFRLHFMCLNCLYKYYYNPNIKFFDLKPKEKKNKYCVECPHSESVPTALNNEFYEVLYCTKIINTDYNASFLNKKRIGKLEDNPKIPKWCTLKE
jgi:hypothetical protein